jgi:aspartate kinase
MNHWIVAKFGGTSMADSEAMKRCAQIVLSNPKIKLIIVSATSGTTNELVKLIKKYQQIDLFHEHDQIEIVFEEMFKRHLKIIEDLELHFLAKDIQNLILEAKVVGKTLSKGIDENSSTFKKQSDRILSIGERISCLIFGNYLNQLNSEYTCFDSRKVLKTSNDFGQAKPNIQSIEKEVDTELIPFLEENKKFICEGFIGSTDSGFTTTLGRGGSDYSASLLGAAIRASEIQIWTDVAGMFSCDPRIVKNPKLIEEIGFEEAAEMCQFGAKVLHPATIMPAMKENIPVRILSTFSPLEPGTKILKESKTRPEFRAITIRKKQTQLNLSKSAKGLSPKFLESFFELLRNFKIECDLINSASTNISITIDESMGEVSLNPNLVEELQNLGTLSIQKNLCLVGIIGNHLTFDTIFHVLKDFKIKSLHYGSSKHGLYLLLENEEQGILASQLLHSTLIERNS